MTVLCPPTMNRQNDSVNLHPLARTRIEKGVTKEGLADRAGLSLRAIERIESGENYPRRSTQTVIAMALGVDPTDIWPEHGRVAA